MTLPPPAETVNWTVPPATGLPAPILQRDDQRLRERRIRGGRLIVTGDVTQQLAVHEAVDRRREIPHQLEQQRIAVNELPIETASKGPPGSVWRPSGTDGSDGGVIDVVATMFARMAWSPAPVGRIEPGGGGGVAAGATRTSTTKPSCVAAGAQLPGCSQSATRTGTGSIFFSA